MLMFDGMTHFFDFIGDAFLNINGGLRHVGHVIKVALECLFLPRQVLDFKLT